MKIGELDQHCGNCKVIDYCTEPYETPCLCCIQELEGVEESEYISIAQSITGKEFKAKKKQYEENDIGWTNEFAGTVCDIVLGKLYSGESEEEYETD